MYACVVVCFRLDDSLSVRLYSHVVVWLVEAQGLSSVHNEVRCVNVITLHHHLENFRLMNRAFFHELDALVLHSDRVVHIVVKLNFELVFELAVFL